jgi:HlyD family secretion protein
MNFMKNLLKKKSVIGLIVIAAAVGGYYIYTNATKVPVTTRYVTATAAKGTVSVSVSGTGQVASSNQVNINPQVGSTITSLPITVGQKVAAGDVIARLDQTNLQQTLRNDQASLDSAKLSLQKLQEPATALTLLQAQNALAQAQTSKQNAQTDLANAYVSGSTAVTNAFLDLPNIMTGLQDVLMGSEASRNQQNLDFYANSIRPYNTSSDDFRNKAFNSYQTAVTAYNKNFSDFKNITSASTNDQITSIINETSTTAVAIAEAIKDSASLVQLYNDMLTQNNVKPIALSTTQLNQLNNFTSTINSHLSSLSGVQQTILSSQNTITTSQQSIAEKQASIAQLTAGPDVLDVKSSQLNIEKAQNALLNDQQTLAYYTVRAPFSGSIAVLPVSLGQQVSSGTTLVTLIADQQVANVSLNETDVAKIKIGQKATLAFDAIDNLIITGEVSSIDLIGTVSQGVVSYNVKIVFDTQDDRIKAGMSVSAAIITNTDVDVLYVPNEAVKTQGTQSYVQVLVNGAPVRKTVVVGLANDTDTEIVSGINEGDLVVTQTITSSTAAKTTTTSATSVLGGSALRGVAGGGGGAGFRGN